MQYVVHCVESPAVMDFACKVLPQVGGGDGREVKSLESAPAAWRAKKCISSLHTPLYSVLHRAMYFSSNSS